MHHARDQIDEIASEVTTFTTIIRELGAVLTGQRGPVRPSYGGVPAGAVTELWGVLGDRPAIAAIAAAVDN